MGYKIGIDVGGTFTDFLLVDDEGSVMIFKTPSTPQNPSLGVINGFKEMSLTQKITLQQFLCQVDVIVHGTTITTNAVLTKNFVKTGFITTKGFRDYLATRRGLKGSVYNPKESPPEPIVPRKLRQTIEERVDCEGKIFIPLKEKDVFSAVEVFRKENVEAVAVNFMFSFANPVHEHKVAQILGKKLPDAYVCISSDVLPQVRMYERASTTVLNACLGPVLRRYIMSLLKIFSDDNFAGILLIMQSNGGMMAPEMAMDLAVNTLLSGPAGAPKAGVFFGDLHNVRDFITIDMGGTSFDACLVINGQPEVTGESEINHYRVATQAIAIQTIGAGGGSIAQLDDRGILCVGPQSAGSSPGPVCYGMSGTEPTVTDANLALGLINPDFFLGGRMKIYPEKAEESIEKKIAHPLELGLLDAAYGIYMVVNSSMAQGVRLASAEKGYDPRTFMLISAGGAGPLHACAIARELEMPVILVPKASSVFCATGMLVSNLRHDFVTVCHMLMEEGHMDISLINDRFLEMKSKAQSILNKEGIPPERMRFHCACDLRYEAQFHEIEVPMAWLDDRPFSTVDLSLLREAFNKKHETLYGYALPYDALELVCLRLIGEGIVDNLSFDCCPYLGEDSSEALKETREIYLGEKMNVQVYDSSLMGYGNRLSGPAIVEAATTTILISPFYDLTCDKQGNYLLHSKGTSLEECLSKVRNDQ